MSPYGGSIAVFDDTLSMPVSVLFTLAAGSAVGVRKGRARCRRVNRTSAGLLQTVSVGAEVAKVQGDTSVDEHELSFAGTCHAVVEMEEEKVGRRAVSQRPRPSDFRDGKR
jgi:hypothetical protein